LKGFAAGSDDYATRPFDLDDLLGRIWAALRRGRAKVAPALLTGVADLGTAPAGAGRLVR
jgi:two-component system, OmpR family, response regulator